jgi:hypothetical protein
MNEPTPAVSGLRSAAFWRAKTQRRQELLPLRLCAILCSCPRPDAHRPSNLARKDAKSSFLCAFAPLRDPLLLPTSRRSPRFEFGAPRRQDAKSSFLCAFAPLRDPLLLPTPRRSPPVEFGAFARSFAPAHPPTLTARRIWHAKTPRPPPSARSFAPAPPCSPAHHD